MKIDSIKNGIVLDHIKAGNSMKIFDALGLADMECSVAILQRVPSKKMGKKDILKIDNDFDIDLDVLGYIDHNITVSYIKDGKTAEKKHLALPERIINVEKCKNPRCITSVERGLDQEFYLANREKQIYRCIYCDTKVTK
jgi:aspartate carbamoyltransferase regulatory subunit